MLIHSLSRIIAWLLAAISTFFTLKAAYAYFSTFFSQWKQGMHVALTNNYCSSMYDASNGVPGTGTGSACKNRQLVFLDASLRNIGTRDIRLCDKNECLYLTCGENYRWLTVEEKVTNPRIIYRSIVVSPREVKFTWDLIKKRERIRMKFLAESTDAPRSGVADDFWDSLQIESRKANMGAARHDSLSQERKLARTRYQWYISLGLICASVGLGLLLTKAQLSPNSPLNGAQGIVFSLEDIQRGQASEAIIRNAGSGHISVLFEPDSKEGQWKKYGLADFNRQYRIRSANKIITRQNPLLKFTGLFFILAGLAIMAINAIRLWAVGNKKREMKFQLLFFQGKDLCQLD